MSLRIGRALLPRKRLVMDWIQPSLIENIQVGSIMQSSTTQTATIASVDLSRAVLIPQSYMGGLTDPDGNLGILTLTNATTVTLSFLSGGGITTYYFAVVQFFPGVLRSLQYAVTGMVSPALTSTTTIAPVNTAKTFLLHLGNNPSLVGTNSYGYFTTRLTLTNETTITATRKQQFAGYNTTTGMVAVEFF